MTGESRHRRLESIFLECVELAPERRASFLDERCAGDPELRGQVEDLLRRDEASADSMSSAPSITRSPAALPPVIGAYTLAVKLGEGGFGEVYEAEQTAPVRRRVAIKILKPGMDSRAVLARFEAERQALALMDHPGIAKVYDAGVTESGRSYFVMERVTGENIARVCDEGRIPLRARLELFVAVCRAVEHAHTKGVIHRDLKPSNILVTTVDGALQPKVIDFGIAKATSAALAAPGGAAPDADAAPRTLQGEVLGTPEYMSPEQAASRGTDVDTRSDVYSLGAVLFRMLTGRVPFLSERLRAGDFETMRRILLDEDPPKPSEVVAAEAAISPRELRGDLDWIVLRALEKDRVRRYPSAAALADDVERHLRDDPVQAGAPTTMYRLGKLVRRHRVLVGGAAAVTLALLAGLAATATQAVRASRAEERARREAQVATAVNTFLARMLAAGDPTVESGGRTLTVREMIERVAREVDENPPRVPAVEAGIRHALGATFTGLGEYEAADAQLTLAESLRAGETTREAIETKLERARLEALCERSAVADSILVALPPSFQSMARDDADLRARYLSMRGGAVANLDRLAEADSMFAEALAIRRAEAAARESGSGELSEALKSLATVRSRRGRLDEAESLVREALEVAVRQTGASARFEVPSAQVRLASVLKSAGKYAEADSLFIAAIDLGEEILGADHPLLAEWLTNRAQARTDLGRLDDAEADLRRAHEILLRAGLKETGREATVLGDLATVLQMRGMLDESLELRLRALATHQSSNEAGAEILGSSWNNVGSTYRLLRRYAEAESAFVAALAHFRAGNDGDPSKIYIALHNLGKTRLDRGLAREAVATLEEAASMGPDVLPEGHPNLAVFATTYGRALAAVGRTQEARSWLTRARDALTASLGPDHSRTKEAQDALTSLDAP